MASSKKAKKDPPVVAVDPNVVFLRALYLQSYSGDSEDQAISTSFRGVLVSDSEMDIPYGYSYSQAFPAPREKVDECGHVYVVVAYTYEYDSFKRSHGNAQVWGIYGNGKKAAAVADALSKVDDGSLFNTVVEGQTIPWGGWGSRLERVIVEALPVLRFGSNPADSKTEGTNPQNLDEIPSW